MKNKFTAKKSLGQHFLRSQKALMQVVDSIEDKKSLVFEIGPGEGVLTQKLLEFGFKVNVVEIDTRSIEVLETDFRDQLQSGQLKILNRNCLEIEYFKEIDNDNSYTLLGNIPYYITGAIFRHTFEQEVLPRQAIFLVQKEVAQRVVANDKKESLISVSVKIFGEATIVDYVKAGSFSPPPKVDSAILNISNIQQIFKDKLQQEVFFTILKAAFSQKRKFLFSNLRQKLPENIFIKYQHIFNEIFIEKYGEKVRAEDVNIADWKKIISNI